MRAGYRHEFCSYLVCKEGLIFVRVLQIRARKREASAKKARGERKRARRVNYVQTNKFALC